MRSDSALGAAVRRRLFLVSHLRTPEFAHTAARCYLRQFRPDRQFGSSCRSCSMIAMFERHPYEIEAAASQFVSVANSGIKATNGSSSA